MYDAFLARKAAAASSDGVRVEEVHPSLFAHQAHVVRRAALQGRSAVFLNTGLGKTRIQLEWAQQVSRRTLVITPLTIAAQTVAEAASLDIEARYVRHEDETRGFGIYVTNYEMQHQFNPANYDAVVLDESSILKNHAGATRQSLIERWDTKFRLACTATPSPNDITELTNHSEFLGAMSRVEMLAAFFVHDQDGWRPKGHASDAMYRWMTSWATAGRRPSDLGPFDDGPYQLPPLNIIPDVVEFHQEVEPGSLLPPTLGGVGDRARMRQATLGARLERADEILTRDTRPSIAWCGLNEEATRLAEMLDVPNLHGALDPDAKVEIIEAFRGGEIPVLVTKPSIAGMGLNLQRATRQVFVGLGDSYEAYYQAIRRSWRFGQTHPVDVHVVVAEPEAEIVANVARKEAEAAEMTERLVVALNAQEAIAA